MLKDFAVLSLGKAVRVTATKSNEDANWLTCSTELTPQAAVAPLVASMLMWCFYWWMYPELTNPEPALQDPPIKKQESETQPRRQPERNRRRVGGTLKVRGGDTRLEPAHQLRLEKPSVAEFWPPEGLSWGDSVGVALICTPTGWTAPRASISHSLSRVAPISWVSSGLRTKTLLFHQHVHARPALVAHKSVSAQKWGMGPVGVSAVVKQGAPLPRSPGVSRPFPRPYNGTDCDSTWRRYQWIGCKLSSGPRPQSS